MHIDALQVEIFGVIRTYYTGFVFERYKATKYSIVVVFGACIAANL